MIPLTISPTALETAQECLAKFNAHAIKKGGDSPNAAALLGTSLHSALEMFVKQDGMIWDYGFLEVMFRMHFVKQFPEVIDVDEDDWYKQGIEICKNWFNRSYQLSDIKSGTIIEKEIKRNFPVPYKINGETRNVPFNYIIDRLDRLDDDIYRVVDYKSQRSPLRADEMMKKLQVRGYSLATRIVYPNAKLIHVQYDFLRYQSVTVTLTREDDARTWNYIKTLLQRIVDTPDDDIPERLGAGCKYCLRKVSCKKLRANIEAEGILGKSIDELIEARQELDGKMGGLGLIIADIDNLLLAYAKAEDLDSFPSDDFNVEVVRSSRRYVNAERIAEILPREVLAKYGHINVGDLDKIKNDPLLDNTQRSLLSTAVSVKTGEDKIKVTPRHEGLVE